VSFCLSSRDVCNYLRVRDKEDPSQRCRPSLNPAPARLLLLDKIYAWTFRISEFGDLQQSSPPIRTSLKEKGGQSITAILANKITSILRNSQFLLGPAFQTLRSVNSVRDTEIHYYGAELVWLAFESGETRYRKKLQKRFPFLFRQITPHLELLECEETTTSCGFRP
jgi:hypothetical protein